MTEFEQLMLEIKKTQTLAQRCLKATEDLTLEVKKEKGNGVPVRR